MESNPSPVTIPDLARPSCKGPRLLVTCASDTDPVWRSEIGTLAAGRSSGDSQPFFSVTETGNMVVEGCNLNQAIEVSFDIIPLYIFIHCWATSDLIFKFIQH